MIEIKEIAIKEFCDPTKVTTIEFDNITPRVFRNFGKVCIMQGTISQLYDKRTLIEFYNPGQELSYSIVPIIPVKSTTEELNTRVQINPQKSNKKGMSLEDIQSKKTQQKEKEVSTEFSFNESDFPPLC